MALRKRGKTWTITIELGFDPATGKRLRDYFTFTGTKKEAVAEEARLLRELHEGTYVPPNRLTMRMYLADWLKRKHGIVTERTYEGYQHIIDNHFDDAFGSLHLTKLRPLHVQNYLDEKRLGDKEAGISPLSALTLRNHYAVLRKALQDAVKLRLISVNPALSVDAPRGGKKETAVLTEAQTVRFLEYARGWEFYLPVYLAAYTGVRRGEVLGFKWEDVDWEAKSIRVVRSLQKTKGGFVFGPPKSAESRRVIALSDSVAASLKEERRLQLERKMRMGVDFHDKGLVCCLEDGEPIDPNCFSAAFRKFQDKAAGDLKIPKIRFHDLRHGHCSHLLHLNQPLKLVSARLGHSTIAITADLYGHILQGQDRTAADLLDVALASASKAETEPGEGANSQ